MKLRVNLPSRIFLETDTDKVVAESPMGSFTLLPRHVDFATALAPGLLSYTEPGRPRDDERFLAVSEGILVKLGGEVLVSVRAAVQGELGELRQRVREMHDNLDEHEQISRSAMARMEASFVRRFLELGKRG